MGVDVSAALGQRRHLEHLLGGQTAQLVQADSCRVLVPPVQACRVLASTSAYFYRAVLSGQARFGQLGGYVATSSRSSVHNFWL